MRYDGVEFKDVAVRLDGQEFVRCTFRQCELRYGGEADVLLEDNNFQGCTWVLEGAASRTVDFLNGLFHGMGPDGRQLVEYLIEGMLRRPVTANVA